MHPRLKVLLAVVLSIAVINVILNDSVFFSFTSNIVYEGNLQTILEGASVSNTTIHNGTRDSTDGLCPLTPPGLVGPIRVWMDGPPMDKLEKLYGCNTEVHNPPPHCISRHKVAIVVPYRDRIDQLRIFLHNMHSLLRKQEMDYGIYIVEQIPDQTFNRAKLMNVGFTEAVKDYSWDCFIFHDVDLLPEDDRNLYSCPAQPRHMSVAVDKFNYKLPYGSIFGGISAMTKQQVERINGFSNDYWGWGGEDDDLSTRVALEGFKISRYPSSIARYKMVKHSHESTNKVNPCRYNLMAKTKRRYKLDGLSNLKYTLMKKDIRPLYTNVLVDLLYDESIKPVKRLVTGC